MPRDPANTDRSHHSNDKHGKQAAGLGAAAGQPSAPRRNGESAKDGSALNVETLASINLPSEVVLDDRFKGPASSEKTEQALTLRPIPFQGPTDSLPVLGAIQPGNAEHNTRAVSSADQEHQSVVHVKGYDQPGKELAVQPHGASDDDHNGLIAPHIFSLRVADEHAAPSQGWASGSAEGAPTVEHPTWRRALSDGPWQRVAGVAGKVGQFIKRHRGPIVFYCTLVMTAAAVITLVDQMVLKPKRDQANLLQQQAINQKNEPQPTTAQQDAPGREAGHAAGPWGAITRPRVHAHPLETEVQPTRTMKEHVTFTLRDGAGVPVKGYHVRLRGTVDDKGQDVCGVSNEYGSVCLSEDCVRCTAEVYDTHGALVGTFVVNTVMDLYVYIA